MKQRQLSATISTYLLVMCLWGIFQSTGWSQQLPLFTQYREVQGLINPASVNHDYFLEHYNISAGITYRSQWNDIAGHPKTTAARLEYVVVPKRGNFHLLTGGYYLQDKTGLTNRQSAYLRLGAIYSRDPSESGIGLGFNAGMVWSTFDFTGVKLTDPNDLVLDQPFNYSDPDIGIGVYYYQRIHAGALASDQFYVGLSVPQFLNQYYEIKNNEQIFKLYKTPHFYGHAGYYKTLSETMYLSGSLWYKYAKGSTSVVDFNARMYMFDKLWVGAGISSIGMVHMEVGTILGKYFDFNNFNFKVGYAADFNIGELANNLGLTHEVNLVFYFDTENK